MVRLKVAVVVFAAFTVAQAFAQGGGDARSSATGNGTGRLSPVVGGGQSEAQARHDNQPGHVRASPLTHPTLNPNQAGAAASDGTAGTSSARSPEPKPNG